MHVLAHSSPPFLYVLARSGVPHVVQSFGPRSPPIVLNSSTSLSILQSLFSLSFDLSPTPGATSEPHNQILGPSPLLSGSLASFLTPYRLVAHQRTSAELEAANGKIAVLEEHSRSQRLLTEQLIAHVNSMEGRLCCCDEGKGKGRATLEEVSPPLGSPLVLGQAMDEDHHSDDSYHTPPLASSSAPASSSPSESDKENVEIAPLGLVEIVKGSSDYDVPLPVPAPIINLAHFNHLITVHGQRVVCKLGPPKLVYHPYSCCCNIGARSSTHKPRAHCSCQ